MVTYMCGKVAILQERLLPLQSNTWWWLVAVAVQAFLVVVVQVDIELLQVLQWLPTQH